MKKALVTGITGQTGSYLAELLLEKGYEVHGVARRVSVPRFGRLKGILDRVHKGEELPFHIHEGDLCSGPSMFHLVRKIEPDEVYNMGAQSDVGHSFKEPEVTGDITGMGVARLLEAIRILNPKIRFYQASTSELFGNADVTPQNEETPFKPRSPYGCAKLYAYWMVRTYREAYDMFASNGVLFNHEGPRRGENFVTRKITKAVAHIKHGLQDKLYLGNLEAKRDWGHAEDYAEAIYLILQQEEPDDFVIATGKARSVRDFVRIAFDHVGLDYQDYVEVDPRFFRPAEVHYLEGDSSKAQQQLQWVPKHSFEDLVKEMVEHDLKLVADRRIHEKT